MTAEQTLGFLEDVGVLDPEGRLARQYGGSGHETASSLPWSGEEPDSAGNARRAAEILAEESRREHGEAWRL